VVDGVIGGVGAVVVFVPLIALLFLTIAFLEDTGYMARAAFVIDRIMHKVGLHGKSFIPMLIGFGCTVPGILATRTLETRRDRLTTILILPLMSCGARLPIYVLILGAFFPERSIDLGVVSVSNQALWLLLIYCIGIVLAVIAGNIFRHTILRGESEPLVMELPPYRLPVLKGLTIHTWERTWLYLKKAGTVILGISIVLWALGTWPKLPEDKAETYRERIASIRADETLEDEARIERAQSVNAERQQARLTHSIIGRIGHGVAPVFKPLGFDWRISTALIGAFAAKEVFVSQMGVVFALGEEAGEDSPSLKEKLQTAYTPLIGFCIMLFCLISTPCMATVAVTIRETGSWKWGLFQLAYLTAAAWVVTAVVYQVGSRL
jgi:ferrous iron transport protein B